MLVEKPKEFVDSYKGGELSFDNRRYTTPRGFRFTDTKDERVKDALQRNSILESSPNPKTLTNHTAEKVMNLRPRQENKELAHTFRFKPAIQAERIAESVAINLGTAMPKSMAASRESLRDSRSRLRPTELDNIQTTGMMQNPL